MSKKVKLYILIVINLIAWGYVGYRIYGALQGDDGVSYEQSNIPIKQINEAKVEDSVILHLNYADPFLKGGNYTKENKVKKDNSSNSATNQTPKTVQVLKVKKDETSSVNLDIKYIGLIKNNDKGTQTALISINGKSYFIKSKDIVEGILCLDINSNFLKLKIGKEIISVKK